MILYLGTSSLIKLYIDDADSVTVRRWVSKAAIVATCRVAYTETISALEIRSRNGDLSVRDYKKIVSAFTADWKKIAVVDFDDIEAGRLVRKYGLKRLAAIHLSAALKIQKTDHAVEIVFSSVDRRLCDAAMSEGLKVLQFT